MKPNIIRSFVNISSCIGLITAFSAVANAGQPLPATSVSRAKEKRQDQIGSVHLSVISVGRWDDYKQALQPKFDLKPADAYSIAVSDGALQDRRVLDALTWRLGITFPGVAAGDTNGAVNNAETATFPGDAEGARTAAGLPGLTNVGIGGLSANPMLRYWAATALYQEVQVLNRYVMDAAYNPKKENAYLVRLQVTLMPYTRDAAYDAWTSLAFFPGDFPPTQGGEVQPVVAKATPAAAVGAHSLANGVRVIPMLVTDDLEALVQNQSVDRLRGFSLALSAILGKAGVNMGVDRMKEDLEQAMGRDYNSLFTVGRFTENTVRCRFGARLQPKNGYVMVPQTHAVTLLVLVPQALNEKEVMRVVGKTEFLNARTGNAAIPRQSIDYYMALLKPLERYGQTDAVKKAVRKKDVDCLRGLCKTLAVAVADNDFTLFKTEVDSLISPKSKDGYVYYESLWADLASVRAGNNFSSAVFWLPPLPGEPKIHADQEVVLKDDGKNETVVLLQGANLANAKVLGKIKLNSGNYLYATAVAGSPDGTALMAKFASIAAMRPPKANGKQNQVDLIIETAGDSSKALFQKASAPVLPVEARPAPLSYAPAIASRTIVCTNACGKIGVVLSKVTGTARMDVDGADVLTVTKAGVAAGTDVASKGKGWTLTGEGRYWLELSNLVQGQTVKFTFSNPDEEPVAFEIPVIETKLP